MKVGVALLFVAFIVVQVLASSDEDPQGPCPKVCGDRCCPKANYVCCGDGLYCAKDPASCPGGDADTKVELTPLKLGQQQTLEAQKCKGTLCPSGCCEEKNYFCCPDGNYCAKTAKDCPNF